MPDRVRFGFVLCLAIWPFGAAWAQEPPEYVGSEACVGCHEEAAQAWTGSHHDLAWTEPGPDTVVADFDGTQFALDGMDVAFRQEDGDYFAKVTEQDGVTTDYKVHSVAGIEPLQQYLLETEPGRLQSFDVVWDTEKGEWFHLYPDQDLPPQDGLHWTGPYKTWNARCAECHATGYKRNFGPRTQSYASTQVEIGVGCEACHGPGSSHLDWTVGKELSEELDAFGFTMSFGQGDTEAEIQQCAGCHSRRESLGDGNPVPGSPYHDDFTLALLRPGLYHADGQIQDEVYVYGSFLQSKMYARGVGCMNCHDAHGATLKAEGNAVCTQCHSAAGNPDFPTLRQAEYDTPAHHNHTEGSEGAQCKSCHMIERVYMGNDGRRDHSFRVPRPDLGAETGAPDACTDCHDDQTQAWAADQIATWFPDSQHRGPHYSEPFAVARDNPQAVSGSLIDIAMDEGQPDIVRATALYLLQPLSSPELADNVAPLLSNPDPLVRGGAAVLQRGAPITERADRLRGALSDPMRSVRIAAAKQMLDAPAEQLQPSQRALLQEAMNDWQRSLALRLDFPETHLVLGGMALTFRNAEAAERAFGEVVRMDPQRAEAWPMLVRLTQITRGPDAARAVLRDGMKAVPDNPELLRLWEELNR
ncbi:multiheme c-type cytochrome [Phaeobacter marinintestinus]|uniref:multiheme c-type cytochrome n=1 Tax=Falsiphaeobacter marinintestinus TaxID=1492905 RepID=UPI0011B6F0D6|nr:multiheme c-type cytochrome [Phaeobacter marinintestinus]